jgi:2-iminobutanoate/2-iminopropanoate deaminase
MSRPGPFAAGRAGPFAAGRAGSFAAGRAGTLLAVLAPACLVVVVASAAAQEAPTPAAGRTVVEMPGVLEGLPFSPAVRAGGLIFLSGQIGVRPGEMRLVEGGLEPETRQTLENVRAVLAAAGASLADVVKCTVFLADIEEWPAFNAIYAEYFPENPPARAAMAASGLALEARVELDCIAVDPAGAAP